jgi:hypothetical protein
MTHGDAGAHLGWKAGSDTVGWRRLGARPAPCLNLKLVCSGIRSAGYR